MHGTHRRTKWLLHFFTMQQPFCLIEINIYSLDSLALFLIQCIYQFFDYYGDDLELGDTFFEWVNEEKKDGDTFVTPYFIAYYSVHPYEYCSLTQEALIIYYK